MFLSPNVAQSQIQGLQNIPPNLAATISVEQQAEIMRWMYDNYIFPQILERMQYEPLWDTLLEMYRIKIKADDLRLGADDQLKRERLDEVAVQQTDSNKAQVSDTLVFDAVDRLKNLNHFISWKDGVPVQYNIPEHYTSSKENAFYHPLADKLDRANGLLRWNVENQEVYRSHLILSGHHYTYGCCFVSSELEYEVKQIMRRVSSPSGQPTISMVPELNKLGVTFEPISIRRLWLNYRLPVYKMEMQPCPFLFEEAPRFSVMEHGYHPVMNPFGYANLDRLPTPEWLFQQQEMQSLREAVYSRLNSNQGSELLSPEFSVEGKWTFYPMLPLNPQTGQFGEGVPLKRFIVQWFGVNLRQGQMFPIRLQELFYPMGRLPIYASQHMPDMDSGAYSLSIGEVLRSHYEQICTAKNQWLDNKNLINNPPSWHVTGSPCATQDVNKPGAKIDVLGPNDFGWRTVPDATQTTVQFLEYLRQQAQTTSKATEAILGQASGGRTTATEASNVYQAAMSGVTTDINLFNFDIMGGYANRVWEACGLWFPQEQIKEITGQYGEPLTIEDINCRIQVKWDVGSTYIESIVMQQHLQYAIQVAAQSQVLRQDILWHQYFKLIKAPQLQQAVVDSGFEEQVGEATEQAIATYMGQSVMVDPTQDHQIALEVKARFLKDVDSNWNKQYGSLLGPMGVPRAMALQQQCMMHQQFIMIQQRQQIAAQQLQQKAAAEQEGQIAQQKEAAKPKRLADTGGKYRQNQGN